MDYYWHHSWYTILALSLAGLNQEKLIFKEHRSIIEGAIEVRTIEGAKILVGQALAYEG